MPYPQALNYPKAKTNESHDHLLEAFKKVTITIPLIDVIKHIPSYAKFLKGICTPHRNHKMIQLSEIVSSITMKSLPIKKRDPRAPMIGSEIGGVIFTKSLLDTGANINILPKVVFDRHHVGELQPFLVELCLADGSIRKPHGIVVMMIDEEAKFNELPLDEPTLELKTLPSTLKYAILDEEKAKPVIILSQLDKNKDEQFLEVSRRNQDAISWTLTDLQGLDPSLCTHRIFLEDESRLVREAQRTLNPKVWEAVKEEILKWLNVEIIYPISDSQWVSDNMHL